MARLSRQDGKKIVEVFVNEEWEHSVAMSREDIDRVYKYMDLLLIKESGEIQLDDVIEKIDTIAVGYGL